MPSSTPSGKMPTRKLMPRAWHRRSMFRQFRYGGSSYEVRQTRNCSAFNNSHDNFHLVSLEVASCRSYNRKLLRHENYYPSLTSPACMTVPLIAAPSRGGYGLLARIRASSTSRGMESRPS